MKPGIVLLLTLVGAPLVADQPIAPGEVVPAALQVDRLPNGTSSNGNAILEPGETVVVEPAWRNILASPLTVTGSASAFVGAGAPGLYLIPDPVASYGIIAAGQVASCTITGDCYRLTVGVPATRPAAHWDATFGEATSTGSLKTWTVHIGDTFTDVPLASPFYRFVETLVHHGITGGCAAGEYCPSSPITREQLAVFVLAAKDGRYFAPVSCAPGGERFTDVPAASPFCRWVEELARRGVVTGCGTGQYCPGAAVSREQMAVFALLTKEGTGYNPPSCVAGSEMFADVPAASPFCRWIQELARRGIVGGCGGGLYCPTAPVTREQMAVFVAATFGLTAYGPAPFMYVVTSANDVNDGACTPAHCSLREALTAANATPNPGVREEIRFAIPGPGPHVITPNPALPPITEAVVLDGYSQPGASANTLAMGSNAVLKIEINLAGMGPLTLTTTDALLRGLALNRSPNDAVAIDGSRNAIEGCFIGTDPGGVTALANNRGIIINTSPPAQAIANRIGGTLPAQRNLISGNGTGILISGVDATLVQGNLIGTDRTGVAALPNLGAGIAIVSVNHLQAAADNVIGGLEQGAGNVISANGTHGLRLSGTIGASILIVSNTRIQANLIGVAANGALLRNPIGIELNGNGVGGTLVGGDTTAPAGNGIAAVSAGVIFTSTLGFPSATTIRGNYLHDAQYGVRGTSAGDITGNLIRSNAAAGIYLEGGRMTIARNSISGHGALGIDLAPAGMTPNDFLDGDTGPNDLQNFPVINSAVRSGNTLTVNGTLASAASATYTVELFASATAHPSGFGEGETFIGVVQVTTDGAGTAQVAVVLPVAVPLGHVITATATDAAGNTSEFSAARVVQ